MTDSHPDFTVIECAFDVAHGSFLNHFVKVEGRWVPAGADDYDEWTWEKITTDYHTVTVVARPTDK